jgi:phosphoglycerol transferase
MFCAEDLFPTTLAAIGCTIPGDRLGLGVNLFSQTKTLTERLGFTKFNDLLAQSSEYYEENFYTQRDAA